MTYALKIIHGGYMNRTVETLVTDQNIIEDELVINIVDEKMGVGKSSAAINMINNDSSNKRYMFITPYLTEITRIKTSCKSKSFKEPSYELEDGKQSSKLSSIKNLISNKENIISTHALFRLFDLEVISLIKENNYTLIMDEVTSVIEIFNGIKKDDVPFFKSQITINEDGYVKWINTEYDGVLNSIKKLCDVNSLVTHNNKDNGTILWVLPVDIFKSFKDVYILTYMFNAQVQRCYYDMFNVKYKYLHVIGNSQETYTIVNDNVVRDKINYKDLISIYSNVKSNKIGTSKFALSSGWYDKASEDDIKTLKNNCSNFFKNNCKTPSELNIWTTFKANKARVTGKGYKKGFVALNVRATNIYQYTTSAAYLANIFINPAIKSFLISNNVEVDEDGFALSEMLQWIWRARIRRNESIMLFVPSSRMRNLLKQWIKDNSPE